MPKLGASLAILALAAHMGAADSVALPPHARPPIPPLTRQLIVVRAASWTSVGATLQRFERSVDGNWQSVGASTPINVGRHGMAWGRGLQSIEPGPQKREGDEKAPAGVFALGPAFGYSDHILEGAKSYPYVHIHDRTSCIEDARSRYYNQVIDPAAVTRPDWSVRDKMLRRDGLFRWGIIVEQNAAATVPGAGSCIFLHIWRGRGRGTAGCTTMPPDAIEEIIRWVDPSKRPVLVQLPNSEYARLEADWGLP